MSKVCVMSARSLGDAVIASLFVRMLVQLDKSLKILVWTKPNQECFFSEISNVECVICEFPGLSSARNPIKLFFGFLNAVKRVRSFKPQYSLDYIGDVREIFYGFLTGAKKNYTVFWHRNHSFRNLIWSPLWKIKYAVEIRESDKNIYDACKNLTNFFASEISEVHAQEKKLKCKNLSWAELNFKSKRSLEIGIHPFASKACREWPMENWEALIRALKNSGHRVSLFMAQTDTLKLSYISSKILSEVQIYAIDLVNLKPKFEKLDLLIGLDSFSIHYANYCSVPSIMINGANDPDFYVTPTSKSLHSSGGCQYWPCFNKPRCIGTASEFRCIKAVSVGDVIAAIDELTTNKSK